MSRNSILVPIDFSDAAAVAVDHAGAMASRCSWDLCLFHITSKEEDDLDNRDHLLAYGETAKASHAVSSEIVTVHGQVKSAIEEASREPHHPWTVLATHGVKGLRQKLFGADALHIAQEAGTPVTVVQQASKLHTDGPIVLPWGGHLQYGNIVAASAWLAQAYGVAVHIYGIQRPGWEPTERMLQNQELARNSFSQAGISFLEVTEPPTVMSVGFARQTVAYAQKVSASWIATMASKTPENSHIAQSDKETLMNNEAAIPVLLTGDQCRVPQS